MVNGAFRAGWVAIAIAALLASPASAQASRTARQAERARAEATAEADRARAAARDATAELAALDAQMAEAAARKAEAENAALDAQLQLTGLDLDTQRTEGELARDRAAVEDLVIAAIFAERAGRSPHRARDAARMEALARALGPGLVTRQRARAAELRSAQAQRAQIAEARAALAAAQAAIAAEQDGLTRLIAAREDMRSRQLAAAGEADRRARRYAAEARNLRELAARVQAASAPRRAGGALGSLTRPVAGTLVLGFGQRTPAGHSAEGLTFSTAGGADVVAPANATVDYAGLFRSYGEILILNLDNGYVIVLAGMGTVRARAGDRVQAGQVVGQMPQMASPAPELYVEVRRNGAPVDPSRGFQARPRAARG